MVNNNSELDPKIKYDVSGKPGALAGLTVGILIMIMAIVDQSLSSVSSQWIIVIGLVLFLYNLMAVSNYQAKEKHNKEYHKK